MKKLIYSIAIVSAAACGGDASADRTNGYSAPVESADDSLYQVVISEHNIAMAKQRQIEVYQKRLDSLDKSGTKEKYRSLRAELQTAYDGMERWMHEFSIDTLQGQPEQRAQYFSSEEFKVVKVKNDILAALAKADSVLKK